MKKNSNLFTAVQSLRNTPEQLPCNLEKSLIANQASHNTTVELRYNNCSIDKMVGMNIWTSVTRLTHGQWSHSVLMS